MGISVALALLWAFNAFIVPPRFLNSHGSQRPRIVGISLERARKQLQAWTSAVGEEDWDMRSAMLMYDMANARYHGTVALVYDDDIRALALLERLANSTHVRSINCADLSSGTVLVSAMCHVSGNLTLAYTVHPRWHIAFTFFSKEKGGEETSQ